MMKDTKLSILTWAKENDVVCFHGGLLYSVKKKKRDGQSLYALKENFLGASVVVGLIKRLVIWEGEVKTDMIDH